MLNYIVGHGEPADLVRRCRSAETEMGDPTSWPVSLRTLVGVMLECHQPMFIVWGPRQRLLYNDYYAAVLRDHHPDALGKPFLEVWSEIDGDLRPFVEVAYAGRPSHTNDIMLVLERNGSPEETHFACSYTPVRRDDGSVAGFF